jgi:hypothetical protein
MKLCAKLAHDRKAGCPVLRNLENRMEDGLI